MDIRDFTVFPQITNRNLKMKGNRTIFIVCLISYFTFWRKYFLSPDRKKCSPENQFRPREFGSWNPCTDYGLICFFLKTRLPFIPLSYKYVSRLSDFLNAFSLLRRHKENDLPLRIISVLWIPIIRYQTNGRHSRHTGRYCPINPVWASTRGE
jgi:hypothetical protein